MVEMLETVFFIPNLSAQLLIAIFACLLHFSKIGNCSFNCFGSPCCKSEIKSWDFNICTIVKQIRKIYLRPFFYFFVKPAFTLGRIVIIVRVFIAMLTFGGPMNPAKSINNTCIRSRNVLFPRTNSPSSDSSDYKSGRKFNKLVKRF